MLTGRAVLCLFLSSLFVAVSTRSPVPGPHFTDPSTEARLIRFLFSRYEVHGKYARPVTGVKSRVKVMFGLRLMHIDLDESEQSMSTSAWLRVTWNDEYLKWNKTDFGEMTKVTLPHEKIWTPDIILVNTAKTDVDQRLPAVQVSYTGRVFWTPHGQFSSACLIDLTNYPFDEHTCDMWFQSIAHYTSHLDLQLYNRSAALDLSTYLDSYKTSQEWDVVDNRTQRVVTPRDVGVVLMYSRRPALRFSLTLKRRPGFKAYLLTAPCLALSLLLSLVFCLPPERPDRHMIAMSLFASFLVLLLILSGEAPPDAASTPKLCLYYCFNMVIIMASVFLSVFVIYISRKGQYQRPVPRWAQQVFLVTSSRLLCVNIPTVPALKSDCPRPPTVSSLPPVDQWRFLAAVLDRVFFVSFLFCAVVAFFVFSPWF